MFLTLLNHFSTQKFEGVVFIFSGTKFAYNFI